jgi:hypothetical protein
MSRSMLGVVVLVSVVMAASAIAMAKVGQELGPSVSGTTLVSAESVVSCNDGIYPGRYDGWTRDAIAQDIVERYRAIGSITGSVTILATADVYQSDADVVGVDPEGIAADCEPDVAIVAEGVFDAGVLEGIGDDGTYPYLMWLVDRWEGWVYGTDYNDDLGVIMERLPSH